MLYRQRKWALIWSLLTDLSALDIPGKMILVYSNLLTEGGLVLLAKAATTLKIPYIASGGIADGRGLAAVLALGAAGANMGTRFLCTQESPIHNNIKESIVKATERDTSLMFRTLHNTARVFKNKVSMEVVQIERKGNVKFEDIRHLVAGERGRKVYTTGDPDYGVWTAGQW
jgi:NAD(P)H-dependent flavin oxidoreductase YrpB (nitropropane dioxygenase family)